MDISTYWYAYGCEIIFDHYLLVFWSSTIVLDVWRWLLINMYEIMHMQQQTLGVHTQMLEHIFVFL